MISVPFLAISLFIRCLAGVAVILNQPQCARLVTHWSYRSRVIGCGKDGEWISFVGFLLIQPKEAFEDTER